MQLLLQSQFSYFVLIYVYDSVTVHYLVSDFSLCFFLLPRVLNNLSLLGAETLIVKSRYFEALNL